MKAIHKIKPRRQFIYKSRGKKFITPKKLQLLGIVVCPWCNNYCTIDFKFCYKCTVNISDDILLE
jgi:hypothetical protein